MEKEERGSGKKIDLEVRGRKSYDREKDMRKGRERQREKEKEERGRKID